MCVDQAHFDDLESDVYHMDAQLVGIEERLDLLTAAVRALAGRPGNPFAASELARRILDEEEL